MTAPTKFAFDREFSATGEVVSDVARYRTQFTRAELEAAQEEGFAAGEHSAIAQQERARTLILDDVRKSLAETLPTLEAHASALKAEAAALAYATARAVAAEALSRFPEENLQALFAEMANTLRAEPVVKIRLSADDAGALGPALHEAARAAGIPASLVIDEDSSAAPGSVRIEWREGALTRGRQEAIGEVRASIANWLALNDIADEQLDLFNDLFENAETAEGNLQ